MENVWPVKNIKWLVGIIVYTCGLIIRNLY
ncbi:hypothetical protein CEAn_00623 [Coxiella endosymbiont of Amblyomma nuttalli]|nr:hypothetical protein CEAn_00623 [Coxiella endosymbiont of Amblyomma nuttalli]